MIEQSISLERMEEAIDLFGQFDENIRLIEQTLGVSVVNRGSDLKINGVPYNLVDPFVPLPVGVLQPFLDEWLETHTDVKIDYIHGSEVLSALQAQGAFAIWVPAMDKAGLFPSVCVGPLPRKTFSMGKATDKRYYLETRRIR